jgi:1-aminocyclopropane-1-carboxylate deaminase
VERYPLTFGPTPIEKLSRLSAHLGKQIWAKREDVNSGLAFGGNKLRKLEYLIPDALAQGADTLVTIGGVQSNHTRQVAAVAAKLGMRCVLVQGSWVQTHEPTYDRVGNLLLSRVLGADILFSREDFSIAIKESWTAAIEEVKKSGGKPYAIPAGASDHPLGGLGYYFFGEELRAQEDALGFRFDVILLASASGSTQGGMVVGLPDREIIGIDVTARPVETRAQIERIAARTSDLVQKKPGPVRLEEGYAYPA